jgi:hypothetical protein
MLLLKPVSRLVTTNGWKVAVPLVKNQFTAPNVMPLGVVNERATASNVDGVPGGPVQSVNVHVAPKLELGGSACATATVVAAMAETHARAARNGLSRFISLLLD